MTNERWEKILRGLDLVSGMCWLGIGVGLLVVFAMLPFHCARGDTLADILAELQSIHGKIDLIEDEVYDNNNKVHMLDDDVQVVNASVQDVNGKCQLINDDLLDLKPVISGGFQSLAVLGTNTLTAVEGVHSVVDDVASNVAVIRADYDAWRYGGWVPWVQMNWPVGIGYVDMVHAPSWWGGGGGCGGSGGSNTVSVDWGPVGDDPEEPVVTNIFIGGPDDRDGGVSYDRWRGRFTLTEQADEAYSNAVQGRSGWFSGTPWDTSGRDAIWTNLVGTSGWPRVAIPGNFSMYGGGGDGDLMPVWHDATFEGAFPCVIPSGVLSVGTGVSTQGLGIVNNAFRMVRGDPGDIKEMTSYAFTDAGSPCGSSFPTSVYFSMGVPWTAAEGRPSSITSFRTWLGGGLVAFTALSCFGMVMQSIKEGIGGH